MTNTPTGYSIVNGSIVKGDDYATWAEVTAIYDARRRKPLTEIQKNALNGVTIAPQTVPARRNTWNDNPPEDIR